MLSRWSDVEDSDDHDARTARDDALLQYASLVLKSFEVTSVFTVHVCRHMHYKQTEYPADIDSTNYNCLNNTVVPTVYQYSYKSLTTLQYTGIKNRCTKKVHKNRRSFRWAHQNWQARCSWVTCTVNLWGYIILTELYTFYDDLPCIYSIEKQHSLYMVTRWNC